MTSPEHHIDGAHVNAPTPPAEAPTALRPGDENDWLPGETEGDREIRLRQLGVTPEPAAEADDSEDLAARWEAQQTGEDGTGESGVAPADA
jgi:hypothetical protein